MKTKDEIVTAIYKLLASDDIDDVKEAGLMLLDLYNRSIDADDVLYEIINRYSLIVRRVDDNDGVTDIDHFWEKLKERTFTKQELLLIFDKITNGRINEVHI